MDASRFAILKQIVIDALELSPTEREGFVRRACGADAELEHEALAILRREASGADLTRIAEAEIARKATEALQAHTVPRAIGPFEILEELGEGGMGVVYRARQRGALERDVAVKLIRAAWDSERVVARFEAERRTLARMDHPNIARVFDAGTTSDGRPWFAMELVQGESFHRGCDARSLSLRARLQLFLAVCRGVHHAHQRGVIHRDLKPSNILISEQDGDPVPKIIDFGIAKALEEPGGERRLPTVAGHLVGTPEYMSPERLAGDDEAVDIRCDVYSLGVMLYELLCGALPFERSAHRAWVPTTAPTDAPRPSSRLTQPGVDLATIARARGVAPRSLRRMLRGELDWIALKAMAPLVDDRYPSAYELQRDVERYLDGEAVSAGPPSAAYRFAKFALRNRLALGAGAAVVLALAIGLFESNRQRMNATEAQQEAETVTQFLTDMLASVDPDDRGRAVTVVELLDEAAASVDARFAAQPRVRSRLHDTLGQSFDALGLYPAAAEHLERALALRTGVYGSRSTHTLQTKRNLADLYLDQGRHDESERLYREVIAAHVEVLGTQAPEVLSAKGKLGELLRREGEYEGAEELHEECYEILLRTEGVEHRSTLEAMNALANDYADGGKTDMAAPLYEEALATSTRTLGATHSLSMSLLNNLALTRWDQGRAAECESLLTRHLQLCRERNGEDHPTTMESVLNLSGVQSMRGDVRAAIAQLEGLLPKARATLGPTHRVTLTAGNNLAWAYGESGDFEQAEALTQEILELRTRELGPQHPETLISMNNLGLLYEKMGRIAEAEATLARTLEERRVVLGDEHPHTKSSVETLDRVRKEFEKQ